MAANFLHESQCLHILSFLSARDQIRTHLVSRCSTIATCAISADFWAEHVRQCFGLKACSPCQDPHGHDCGGRWHIAFARWYTYALQFTVRIRLQGEDESQIGNGVSQVLDAAWMNTWWRLRRWLDSNAVNIARTLREAAAAELFTLLREFAGEEPIAESVWGLWCFCDGQDMPVDGLLASDVHLPASNVDSSWWNGLFGGLAAGVCDISTLLLPLRSALSLTRILQQGLARLRKDHPKKLAFACSSDFSKIFLVDVCDGMVFVWTRRPMPMLEVAIPSHRDGGSMETCKDCRGIQRWMEEYTNRLEAGVYNVVALKPSSVHSTLGISLFPSSGLGSSRAIWQGVEVFCSSVYMPEHQQPTGFCISFSFRLIDDGEERDFTACQLKDRRLKIKQQGREPEHTYGDGLGSFFPILNGEGWLHNKESDPHNNSSGMVNGFERQIHGPFSRTVNFGITPRTHACIDAEFTFVPGTLRSPCGEPFRVKLPPLQLHVPEYIF